MKESMEVERGGQRRHSVLRESKRAWVVGNCGNAAGSSLGEHLYAPKLRRVWSWLRANTRQAS